MSATQLEKLTNAAKIKAIVESGNTGNWPLPKYVQGQDLNAYLERAADSASADDLRRLNEALVALGLSTQA